MTVVEVNPEATQLPGGAVLQGLISSIGQRATVLALAAFVVPAGTWLTTARRNLSRKERPWIS